MARKFHTNKDEITCEIYSWNGFILLHGVPVWIMSWLIFFYRNIYVMYMFVNAYNFDQYWRERRDLRLKMIILSLVYVECGYFSLVGSDPLPQWWLEPGGQEWPSPPPSQDHALHGPWGVWHCSQGKVRQSLRSNQYCHKLLLNTKVQKTEI